MDAYEEGSGGRRQKPCRACNDFKTWMKMGPSSGKEPDNNSNNKSSDRNSAMHLVDTKAGAGSLIPGKKILKNCCRITRVVKEDFTRL